MKIAELRAKINLDSTGFKNGVAKAKSSVQSFASSAKKSFVGISRDAISAGAAMLAAFAGISLVKSMVNLGSSAEETADKFNSVFGKAADGMNERLQELKKVIPATTKELQDAVAVFGLMAQSFGLNDRAAEEFSLNMAKIAGDLSSFHDIAPEVAFDKLRAGIAGSSEPLQALGIDIREAALKQEALNIGIYDGVGVLSTSQKAMAIQSAVVTQMGAASGNAALTMNSTANQMKFMAANAKEAGTIIGTILLPYILDFARGMELIGNVSSSVWQKIKNGANNTSLEIQKLGLDFDEIARKNLEARGTLEETRRSVKRFGNEDSGISVLYKDLGKLGAIIDTDTAAVARNQKMIADRAAELRAEYEKLSPEVRSIMESTGATVDKAQEIADANERLRLSIEAQIKAQGEFQAQQKIQAENDLKTANLKEQILQAEAFGNYSLMQIKKQELEIELAIQKIMKDANVEREKATELALSLFEKNSILSDLKLAMYEAEANGNTALIDQTGYQFELESLILKLMNETNISREKALELALGLLKSENAQLEIMRLEQEIMNAKLNGQKWLAEEKQKELNREKDILKIMKLTGKSREQAEIFEQIVTDEQRKQLELSNKIVRAKGKINKETENQIDLEKKVNNVSDGGGGGGGSGGGKRIKAFNAEDVGRGMSKDELLLAIMRQEDKLSKLLSRSAKNGSSGLRGLSGMKPGTYIQSNIKNLKAALSRLDRLEAMKNAPTQEQRMENLRKMHSESKFKREEERKNQGVETNSYLKSIDSRISSITNSLS